QAASHDSGSRSYSHDTADSNGAAGPEAATGRNTAATNSTHIRRTARPTRRRRHANTDPQTRVTTTHASHPAPSHVAGEEAEGAAKRTVRHNTNPDGDETEVRGDSADRGVAGDKATTANGTSQYRFPTRAANPRCVKM